MISPPTLIYFAYILNRSLHRFPDIFKRQALKHMFSFIVTPSTKIFLAIKVDQLVVNKSLAGIREIIKTKKINFSLGLGDH